MLKYFVGNIFLLRLKFDVNEFQQVFTKEQSVETLLAQHNCLILRIDPPMGWVKLHTDVEEGNQAVVGGLLRDSWGKWITGFMIKIGYCNTMEAEGWVISAQKVQF